MSNLLKKEKGFTLIEVVLVLAIAGLLLVIVFLAVSGAQKSRRDSQRKNDNARLMAQVESCAGNNAGTYAVAPCNVGASYTGTGTYAPANFKDPLSDGNYTVNVGGIGACTAPTTTTAAVATIEITGRQVRTQMCLEQGEQILTNN